MLLGMSICPDQTMEVKVKVNLDAELKAYSDCLTNSD